MTMSWYSDGQPFDEYEGCDRCNFNQRPSRETCEGCKSSDKWCYKDWESEEEECDVDLDEAAAFMVQLAKKEKIGSFEADDVRWIVDGQMEYWDSLNEE